VNSQKKIFNPLLKNHLGIFIVIVLMFVFRLILLRSDAFPFNSDEAIVGLMAKHILGGERPIFFYGQVYMGSLDAFLIAFLFKMFGENVIWIRIVQLVLYALSILEIYFIVLIVFENKISAFFTGLFFAFPVVNIVLYTTVSLGGYGEALTIGLAVILLAVIFAKPESNNKTRSKKASALLLLGMGILSGVGIWANALSLIFTVPGLLFAIYHVYRVDKFSGTAWGKVAKVFIGGVIGASLWIYGLFLNGDSVIAEMFGSAVSVEQVSFLSRTWNHFVSFILFAPTVVFGFRPPWSVNLIGIVLIPIVIVAWIVIFRNLKLKLLLNFQREFLWVIFGTGLFLMSGYLFTSFGTDPSGRYFLPFSILLAVLFGLGMKNLLHKPIFWLIPVVILGYQIYGSVLFINQPPFITTQFYEPAQVDMRDMETVMTFLKTKGETSGYCNYWVSYPMAFLSDEEIICVPKLPYHPDLRYTGRDNRIDAYNETLQNQEEVFYITTKNSDLDRLLVNAFVDLQVNYQYQEIGEFHVFYDLSKKIIPEQLVTYGLKQ